jgi:hypothetical protein
MNGVLAAMAAWGLSYGAMAALGLAMNRHHEQLTGQRGVPRRRRIALRVAGVLLLALALWACRELWGPSVGGWAC